MNPMPSEWCGRVSMQSSGLILMRIAMTDPRNAAHDKKVQQEKKHRSEEIAPGADETVQPGKKPHMHHEKVDDVEADASAGEGSGEDSGHA